MFLAVLFFLLIYLAVSIGVVRVAAKWAKKRNRRPWLWGGLAAFVMYNLVFWDWIPTIAMHKYYCATEAGFWVYKTPEQWMKENPGVMETLKPYPNPEWGGIQMKNGSVDRFNDRFGDWDKRDKKLGGFLIQRKESAIVDVETQEFLTYEVDFLSGPREAGAIWKSWLIKDSCYTDEQRTKNQTLESEILAKLKMTGSR